MTPELQAFLLEHGFPLDQPDAPGANGLTPLMRAAKLQKRAARHGAALQGADAAALADAAENLQTAQPASAQAEQAVGVLLFAAANLARQAGVDPEQALQKANEAFCTAAGPVA